MDLDFTALVTLLGSIITDIRNLHALQVVDNTGITLVKSDVRKQLIDAMFKVIYAVDAHAIYTNDPQLQSSVSHTLTDLIKSRDNVLADTALSIYNIAWPIRVALATRRLAEADSTRVSELQQKYITLISDPSFALGQTMTATKEIREKMAQSDDLLNNKIDRTIKIFNTDHPDFIDQYFIAREIINLGHRYTNQQVGRITGTVLQAVTLIPLHNARIEVIGAKRSTKTNDKGFFTLDFRKKSFVTLRISFAGHNIYTSQPITITSGNLLNLEIQLSPI